MHALPTTRVPARVRTVGPPTAPLLAAAAGAGGLVVALWLGCAIHAPGALDRSLYNSVHGTRGTTETGVAKHLTWIGDGVPLIAVLGLLGLGALLVWRRWEPLAVTALAVVLGSSTSTALKAMAGRTRPPTDGWMSSAGGDSFPSGHTTAATAGYLTLAMCVAVLLGSTRARALVMSSGAALALAIGWTRVELGVHWPSDVLAGWAVGAGAACVALACWTLAPPTLRS
jgi:undecaprenyl-diphosphatase